MISKKPDLSQYNKYKEFEGKKYTGVKVGRGHKWYYEPGEWKEKKVTPDKWQFEYNVGKRRTGNAPEGSGAAVGTEYHWYIIADQIVKKLDANNYSTEMTGSKYKVAHKRANKEKWSATDKTQRRYMIKILQEVIKELKKEPIEEATPQESNAMQKKPKSRQQTLISASQ